ncbi:MAG: metal-dependent transcriptional regulator [Sulfolobales archaeon]
MRRNTKYGRGFEDYLESIYRLKLAGRRITISNIARDLGVKPSSVVEQLEKLAKMDLIRYEKGFRGRSRISLTRKGETLAKKIYEKHSMLKKFLINILHLPEDVAEKDACSMEHYLHKETIKRLSKLYNYLIEEMTANIRFKEGLNKILFS